MVLYIIELYNIDNYKISTLTVLLQYSGSRQGQLQLLHDQLNDTNFESTYDTFVIGVNDKLMNP